MTNAELLYNVAEESRLKSRYWQKRAGEAAQAVEHWPSMGSS